MLPLFKVRFFTPPRYLWRKILIPYYLKINMKVLIEELKESLEKALNFSSESEDGILAERNRYNPCLGSINFNHSVDSVSSEKLLPHIAYHYLLRGYEILKEDGFILANNCDEELIIEFQEYEQGVRLSVSRNHLFDFTI